MRTLDVAGLATLVFGLFVMAEWPMAMGDRTETAKTFVDVHAQQDDSRLESQSVTLSQKHTHKIDKSQQSQSSVMGHSLQAIGHDKDAGRESKISVPLTEVQVVEVVCGSCTNQLRHLELMTGRDLTTTEMMAYFKSDDYLVRQTLQVVCPACMYAIQEYEATARGRLLDPDQMEEFMSTRLFSQYLLLVQSTMTTGESD